MQLKQRVLLFSFLKVFSIDLESFQKTDEALALFVVDELTNTVKIHFRFAAANCMQVVNKTNIQDKNANMLHRVKLPSK